MISFNSRSFGFRELLSSSSKHIFYQNSLFWGLTDRLKDWRIFCFVFLTLSARHSWHRSWTGERTSRWRGWMNEWMNEWPTKEVSSISVNGALFHTGQCPVSLKVRGQPWIKNVVSLSLLTCPRYFCTTASSGYCVTSMRRRVATVVTVAAWTPAVFTSNCQV